MYLKCNKRKKDGKIQRYWSVMESDRLANGRSAKRQVLYLGEINDSQKSAWCKIIEAFEGNADSPRQIALLPSDRQPPEPLPPAVRSLQIDLSKLSLKRPRQCGACWLALQLWDMLDFGDFFGPRLLRSGRDARRLSPCLRSVCRQNPG
jgi:hypothetical protein